MTSAAADSADSSRIVTPRVSTRAWLDPHVRTTWLAAVVLIVVGICFLFQSYTAWRTGARLITDGIETDATIIAIDGTAVARRSETGDRAVEIRYTRDEKVFDYKVPYLDGRTAEELLIVGQTFKIRVDPHDPGRWSPRHQPTPLGQELVGGGIVLATGIILALIAALLRAKVLKTYRDAPRIAVVILSAKHAAIAPRAWQARCSPVPEGDDRVFTVYAPARVKIENGTLHLLTPARGRVLALEWFE